MTNQNQIDSAENQTPELPENLEQKLETALLQTAQDINTPDIGVSVGVVTPEGKWNGATGLSNLETQEATQPDDLFKIASISKAYTSTVILKLQEQGKPRLDDTIDKWLPEIAEKITNGENLTIRQLLDGTGGVWDYFNLDGEFLPDFIADYLSGSNRDWQPEELVTYAFDKPAFSGSDSTEKWTYTNTGNLIAALIAEKATGEPFKQILDEEILEPLGLDNTFFTTEDVSLEKLAKGYDDILTGNGNIGQDGNLEDYTAVNTEISYGSGSIVSSAEDVAKFFDSLASGALLSPESTAEIFNYVDTGFNRSRTQLDKFGLGVYPSQLPWGETRSMDGSQFGYRSQVDYFSSSDTTISILANRGILGNPQTILVIEAYKASIANTLGLNDNLAINGTETDNYLTGTSNNDVINGRDGNDILVGKKGLDALDGGKGDDFLSAGAGNDYLFGKEGDDNLYGGKDDDFLNGGVGNDLLQGGKGSDFLVGGDGQDLLQGGKDDDLLSGGAGNDLVRDTQGNNSLYGNDGDDLLFAGSGNDRLYGDAGSDRAFANAGNDQLFGGKGDDYLNSGKGDDNLIGGEGNDTLIGLSGSNTLTGGAGSDRFILSEDGTNTITDFTQGKDLLELPENISFSDLDISQGSGDHANNTLITFNSETLAVLNNINSEDISQSDFEDTTQTLSFPKPTGDHAVGTTSYHFIDPEREETYTEDPDDKREITAKVWYPSENTSSTTAPYMSENLSNALATAVGIPPQDFTDITQSIPTNSIANAPIAKTKSEYPVLFLSHGFGGLPELNTIKAEELASQGYVVIALNHTYDSTVNLFPDGRVITQSPTFGGFLGASENPELFAESIDIRAKDAQFVLDELEEIDTEENSTDLFGEKLDLDRVGILGYSLGGATAAKVLAEDSRFKAGINLDGGLFGDVASASLSQPFLTFNNEAFSTGNSSDPLDKDFNQIQQSFVENLQNEGYEVTISGTTHSDFNDIPFLSSFLANSGIELGALGTILDANANNSEDFEPTDPELTARIINDYTTAFFEQHLNDRESPLLAGETSPYSEVMFQSYNVNSPEPQFGTVNADVLEIDSTDQLVFAGEGNDLIDATTSNSNNRLYGGDGDDTLILGTGDPLRGSRGDRIVADAGADLLFVGKGGDNTLTGGTGADQFWIAVAKIPSSPNIVTDYNPTEDIIGISGLGIGFEELNLTQQEDDVLIQANGRDLAIFQGVTTDNLGADNFVFA
ncbi:Serine-type D-Ala-D-Ala carboxypeptidase [Hyella patelloides LEGE 07179]|uniref:Serine-type D-Ala-D-Ala carboxypeptidase n=1 Tax=Hyella patelloides LEGE 07179 TaxID=945734 RepID=A0A563VQM5_9CYAN|nr:serine hydrolase [Hyella patelloides]VEP13768.1 Serine-type D-Ala-D-Ala carboxypeptidase [Hyella patelloides LEGE 07179]